MNKLRIGLDIDDTLGDFYGHYKSFFNAEKNPRVMEDKNITKNVEVEIRYDNYFWDNKERERFEGALGVFEDAKQWMGKYYSAETMMRMVFGMTPEEVQGEYNKIKSEVEEGSIFNPLYQLQAAEAESDDGDY